MRVLKNVFRRKTRAFLTIFGITIGVLALVVMGAMAEKINLLVDGGIKYYSDKVIVSDANANAFTFSPMSVDKIGDIEKVPGVAHASASIMMTLDKEPSTVNMGPPPSIVGVDGRSRGYESFKITYKAGREIRATDRGKAVVGADLVSKLHAKVGGDITVRDHTYEVVGIMDKTLTAPDNEVVLSLADAQVLFKENLPKAIQASVNEKKLCTGVAAYAKSGVDPNKLAKTIEHDVVGIQATGPKGFEDQIVSATRILSSIIVGIALISLLVGGLSVVNTMTMAVAERTREIGVRKAIGATSGAVMRQFVAESGVIGLVGGLLGLGIGSAMAYAFNSAGNASGTALFLVTTRLAVGSVSFALVLGVLSGLYPAWHAARLNPVQALRYE